MFDLSQLYYPITARPAGASEVLPCKALRPYIRCFWGPGALPQTSGPEPKVILTGGPTSGPQEREVIIPDTCMDIIWEWDEHTGESEGVFCGINDAPFEVGQAEESTGRLYFAIRFHFWAVHLFTDDHLRDVLNVHVPVEQYFASFRKELGYRLAASLSYTERIAMVEEYLLERLERTGHSRDSLLNAVYSILRQRGAVNVRELESSAGVSSRQLERLFREYIGLSPKKTADLVRFQNVWLDIYRSPPPERAMQDVVYDYHYSHQSHMINSFKKFAGRTPLEALAYARR
ncbi:helix-turn-helix domain-containing protein [Paenibacillus sp. sgz5001063]|uniref:helix-turn-helix domain-containing protein n=1 Tax=Paenibacillus sp. sgz5001063 TaxID=3242474 RepID=UPI0036D2AF14